MREGYGLSILVHSNYGRALNAAHFVFHQGMNVTLSRPQTSIPQVIRHFVNSAS